MGTTTMDGTEQTIFESTELGEFSGWVFLDKLLSGDSVELKVYVVDENDEDDPWKLWAGDTYSGVLPNPALRLEPVMATAGIKMTAKQTTGTYRQITHQWFKR